MYVHMYIHMYIHIFIYTFQYSLMCAGYICDQIYFEFLFFSMTIDKWKCIFYEYFMYVCCIENFHNLHFRTHLNGKSQLLSAIFARKYTFNIFWWIYMFLTFPCHIWKCTCIYKHIYIYSQLHMECHSILFSNPNLFGLFSTEFGKRDLVN